MFIVICRDFATKQAIWRLEDISRKSNETGLGSLRAKFDVIDGPCSPTPVTVQFSCSDASLSGLDFEMNCTGYRVSLVKKTIVSSESFCCWQLTLSLISNISVLIAISSPCYIGRYTSEADCNTNYACI